MKLMSNFFSVRLLMAFMLMLTVAVSLGQNPKGIVPGRVKMKFKPAAIETVSRSVKMMGKNKVKPGELRTGIAKLDAVAVNFKGVKMTRVFPDAGAFEARQRKYGLHLWYEMEIDPSLSVSEAVSQLKGIAELEMATVVSEIKPVIPFNELKPKYVDIRPMGSEAIPLGQVNDPGFNLQWHYENNGQSGGYVDADIDLLDAWNINAGKSNVIVAIVDQGVDYNHVDLKDNMWVNTREKNGTPGVDDDSNGYVDDIYGYNFAGYTGGVVPGDHGTHVAGTVAATNNNGKGVSGVAGGSGKGDGVRLMSTQIFGETTPNTAAAIVYGANNGAVISQNSWGYNTPGYQDPTVNAAIEYFVNEAGKDASGKQVGPMNGGIVIFAAGNNGANQIMYPGANPSVLAVGATNVFDNKASYSNYADWVDISAPGGETSSSSSRGVLSTVVGDKYAYFQGTSMACPHVSGVAALIVSQYGKQGYTPTDLRNRMYATVDNFIAMSPDYAGLMGKGRLNAGKALMPDDGIAPDPIADLTGTGISQTRINISWTAPSDKDNAKAENYKVFYSTQAFDSAQTSLSRVRSFTIDSAKAAGVTETTSIQNLLAGTTYYVSVQSRDQWGNPSKLSNQVMVTTKTGPTTVVNTDTIRFSINVAANAKATATYALINNGGGEMYAKNSIVPIRSSWARTTGYNDTLRYETATSVNYWVGDDQPVPFNAATRFTVPANRTTAFTLTHVANYWRRQTVTDSVILFIYRGGSNNPNSGKLIHREAFKPSSTTGRLDHLKLNGMYSFQPGETFWVVFEYSEKFAQVQAGVNTTAADENFLASSDRGITWQTIASIYRKLAWLTWAESNEGMITSFISAAPDTATVAPNSNINITLNADAKNMRNGTYYLRAQSENNDQNNQFASKPIVVTVTGQPAVLSSKENIVDMGKPYLTKFSENTIWLYNIGLNTVTGINVTSSNGQFTTVTVPSSITPGDSAQLKIRFTPTIAGYQSSDLTVNSSGGMVKISAAGVGIDPPVVEVRDTTVYMTAMVDSTVTGQFTVSNKNGKYPLSISFPAIAALNKPNAMQLLAKGVDPYSAYEWIDNREVGGPVYNWYDISATGQDVSQNLMNDKQGAAQYDLGFRMNFYGDTISTLYVTNQGLLTIRYPSLYNTGGNKTPLLDSIPGYIAPLFLHVSQLGITDRDRVRVYMQREPGRFIVQWEDMRYTTLDPIFGTVMPIGSCTFQAIVYSDGHMEFNYKTLGGWEKYGAIIGLESKDQKKGFNLHENYSSFGLKSGSSIWIVPVTPSVVTKVNPLNTVVPAGEEIKVTLTASAKGLVDGTYKNNVQMTTNDPVKPSVNIPVSLTVTGSKLMTQNNTELDFGSLPVGGKKTLEAILYNAGTQPINITSISSNNGAFVAKMNTAKIPPFSQARIPVEYRPAATGNAAGVMTVITDYPAQTTWSFNLKGSATEAAAITWNMSGGQTQTLNQGDSLNASITISNPGKAPLQVSLEHPYWLRANGQPITSGFVTGQKTYSVHLNVEGKTQSGYEWIAAGKGYGTEAIIEPSIAPYQTLTLPFEFPFYGKKYKEIHITYKGSFYVGDSMTNATAYASSYTSFPNTATPNGIITMGNGQFITYRDNLTGLYPGGMFYKAYDDKFVITYEKVVNSVPGNSGLYTMQTILYKDGRIKTQYAEGETANTSYQLIHGIENEAGTDGIMAFNRTYWQKNGAAIDYVPSKMLTLAPGESATIPLTWLTQSMGSGRFKDSLTLVTNDPLQSKIHIPIELQIAGQTKLQAPDTLNFGTIIAYRPTPSTWAGYTQPVTLENTGNTVYNVTGITFSKPSSIVRLDPNQNLVYAPFKMSPGDKVTLQVQIRPDTTASYLPNFKEVMRIATDIPNFRDSVILVAKTNRQPNAVQDSTLFNITLQKGQDATRSFAISDTGRGPLEFSGVVNYRRNGIRYQSDGSGEIVELDRNQYYQDFDGSKLERNKMVLMAPYTDSLYYYDPARTDVVRSGSSRSDIGTFLAERYVAGTKGMNLQYVRVAYNTERDTSFDLTIRIRAGVEINTSSVIYQQVKRMSAAVNGRLVDVKLDSAILLYPNEQFFVELEYPENFRFPQLSQLAPASSFETKTHFRKGFPQDAWVPWNVAIYPIIGAFEETDIESGWLKVDPISGNVASKASNTVKLDVEGDRIAFRDEIADVLFNTNDPVKKTLGVRVQVRIDQAPYFVVNDTLVVNEGDTLRQNLALADDEGGVITAALINPVTNASISKLTDGTHRFEYRPGYTEAGIRPFPVRLADDKGNNVNDTLIVKVINTNRKPVAAALTEKTIYVNQAPLVLDLKTIITDPDNEPLTYRFDGDTTNKANVSLDLNGVATIFGLAEGNVSLRFTGTDKGNLQATATQPVKVVANRAPVAKAEIPAQYIETNGAQRTINLSDYFSDPDGDALSYAAAIDSTELATVTVGGNQLSLLGKNAGNGVVTVTANDGKGGVMVQSFLLTVLNTKGNIVDDYNITVGPNPFRDQTSIRFTLGSTKQVRIDVVDMMGRVHRTVFTGSLNAGAQTITTNLGNLAAGNYIFRFTIDGKQGMVQAAKL